MKISIETSREDHRVAWLAALAIAIHVAESALPSPVPGIKPGFANIVTVVVLVHFGWSAAAWVAFLRVAAGSLLLGTFLSPTFVLSFGGAVAALGILWPASRFPRWAPGPLGYSVLAALAHMAGQFGLAYLLFVPHPAILRLFPVLMTAALIFGTLNGIISTTVARRISV